jgi:hypothetical protein
VFNVLKVTLGINKATTLQVLITSSPILFFFPVNQMPSHAS